MLKQNGPHTPKSCKTKWTTWKSWMQCSNQCTNTNKCIIIIDGSVPKRACVTGNLVASKTLVHSAIWTCCHNRPKKLPQHFHFFQRKIVAIDRCSNCRTWIWVGRGVNWAMTLIWRIPLKHRKMVRHHVRTHRPKIQWRWRRSKGSIGCQSGLSCMALGQRVITCGFMRCAQHWWQWKIVLWFASIGRLAQVCRIMYVRRPIHGWSANSWHFCWKVCKNTKVWIWAGCILLASVWAHTCPVLLVPICQGFGGSQVCDDEIRILCWIYFEIEFSIDRTRSSRTTVWSTAYTGSFGQLWCQFRRCHPFEWREFDSWWIR